MRALRLHGDGDDAGRRVADEGLGDDVERAGEVSVDGLEIRVAVRVCHGLPGSDRGRAVDEDVDPT